MRMCACIHVCVNVFIRVCIYAYAAIVWYLSALCLGGFVTAAFPFIIG